MWKGYCLIQETLISLDRDINVHICIEQLYAFKSVFSMDIVYVDYIYYNCMIYLVSDKYSLLRGTAMLIIRFLIKGSRIYHA